jgi:hypothetical protein
MDRKLEEALGRLGDLGRGFAAHCEGIQSLQNELIKTLRDVRVCVGSGQKLSPDELRIALKDFWVGLVALGPTLVTLIAQKETIEMEEISCFSQTKQCLSYDRTSDALN